MHLLHHAVEGIQRYGPVYSTWMYPFERFNSWLCRRVLNRARPEATVMETYRASSTSYVCMLNDMSNSVQCFT